MAGAATTELPAANDHRTSPVRASNANMFRLIGLVSIEAAKTTPLATLAGPNPMQVAVGPGGWTHWSSGFAVCHRILPSLGSSADHDPFVVCVPDGCRVC